MADLRIVEDGGYCVEDWPRGRVYRRLPSIHHRKVRKPGKPPVNQDLIELIIEAAKEGNLCKIIMLINETCPEMVEEVITRPD